MAFESDGAFDLPQALRDLFAEQVLVGYEVSSKVLSTDDS